MKKSLGIKQMTAGRKPGGLGILETVLFLQVLLAILLPGGNRAWADVNASGTANAPAELFDAFLYFADPESAYLKAIPASLPSGMEDHALGMTVLNALMAGPSIAGPRRIFPESLRVNALFITGNGDAYVDLGSEDRVFDDAIGEYLGIYSLVNTLAVNIPGIRRVKILVNGSDSGALGNHLDLGQFFTTNMRIVK